MKIAIDFDGTVVDHRFSDVGPDVPGAVGVIKKIKAAGHKVFLYTMRSGQYLEDAVKWYGDKGISLDGINTDPEQTEWTQSPKCFCNLLIDDVALGMPMIQVEGFVRRCVNWCVAENILESRGII